MKLILILIAGLILSCNSSRSQRAGTITIKVFNDTCYYLLGSSDAAQLEINRKLEILENTLSDTILLGTSVLPVGYKGTLEYRRVSDTINSPYAPDIDVSLLPKAKTICVNLYQRRPVQGILKIKYYYY